MTSHMDTESLALLAEGLLDEDEESSARAHLAECEQCSAQSAELTEVSRLLAADPTPPLPDGVVERLDEALHQESRQQGDRNGSDSEPATSESEGTVTPLHRNTGLSRWMPYLIAAAAVVFVTGGSVAVVQSIGDDSETSQLNAAPHEEALTSPDAAAPYQPELIASGTEYMPHAFESQAVEALSDSLPPDQPAAAESESAPTDSPTTPPGLARCLDRVADVTGERPVTVDLARYEGEPAWVLLFGSPSAEDYRVRAVSPACGDPEGDSDSVATSTLAEGVAAPR